MTEDTIPAWLHEFVMSLQQKIIEQAIQQQETSLEQIKFVQTHEWANRIRIYEVLIQTLEHPRGGPEVAIKMLRDMIEQCKQFDQEED